MINAIKYMDDLIETGFTQEQSKTTVSMWMELMNENLATKSEFKDLEHKIEKLDLKMQQEFAAVRHELKDMESRLTIKLGGMLAAAIGLIALIQKL